MIRFLIDSSAVWRILREPELGDAWAEPLLNGAIGSCEPQRAEFRRSARNAAEYEQMTATFHNLFPVVNVPKTVWRWIDGAQYRLAAAGATRALSVVDLLVCATAAERGLIILHDDADFDLANRHLDGVKVRRVRDVWTTGTDR